MTYARIVLIATALISTATACGESPEGPVEPVGKTPKETGWKAVTVTRGLDHPWAMAWLPDGKSMLITERGGRLRVTEDGKLRSEPVSGLPENIIPIGQGGLLDIALHPKFEKNRLVYMTCSTGSSRANRTTLIRGRIDEGLARLTDVKELFRVSQDKPGGQHFGSRLLWLKDGTLLMSTGDGGNPPVKVEGRLTRYNAQDLSSQIGKVLRLDENGKAPDDNPFARDDDPKTDPYIWSYGHRNIQGMTMHPETGDVWATEHGARGGDELNLLEAGKNYGWHKATYSMEYTGGRISEHTSLPGMVDPKVVWTPCIAPSGLAFYTGNAFGSWKGDLLAGGLVLRQIRRIHFKDGKITGQTTLQFEDRIRSVAQGPDGRIYVLTDEVDGRVLRLEPDK